MYSELVIIANFCYRLYIMLTFVIQSQLFKSKLCISGALKSPVYRYLVTYTPSKQANASRWLPFPSRFAFHLLDSLAFFGGLEMVLGTLSPADISFQEMITKYFVHFAKEGKFNTNNKTIEICSKCLTLFLEV